MSSFNQTVLIGNLGKDPEIICPSGRPAFAKMQIATHRRWKKDNQVHIRTDWHTVMCNGKQVERIRLLHKGDRVFVSGTLVTEKWQDKEGHSRLSIYVQARQAYFLSSPKAKPQAHVETEIETVDEDLLETADTDFSASAL